MRSTCQIWGKKAAESLGTNILMGKDITAPPCCDVERTVHMFNIHNDSFFLHHSFFLLTFIPPDVLLSQIQSVSAIHISLVLIYF